MKSGRDRPVANGCAGCAAKARFPAACFNRPNRWGGNVSLQVQSHTCTGSTVRRWSFAGLERAVVADGRCCATAKYRSGWSERLGSVPQRLRQGAGSDTIWIHAVSVGEVLAVTQLVAELKQQLHDYRIVISTTTDTGQKLARQKFGEENVFRAPLDLPWAVQSFLDALRPRMLVLAESEFWPKLLHHAHQIGRCRRGGQRSRSPTDPCRATNVFAGCLRACSPRSIFCCLRAKRCPATRRDWRSC